MSHEIIWEDDGIIGYRCAQEPQPTTLTGTIDCETGRGEAICSKCGTTLKAIWNVTLTEALTGDTEEP